MTATLNKIPIEVRSTIYELLLIVDGTITMRQAPDNPEKLPGVRMLSIPRRYCGAPKNDSWVNHQERPWWSSRIPPPPSVSILRVCRQFHDEAVHILYRFNTFYFRQNEVCPIFLLLIGTAAYESITSIDIRPREKDKAPLQTLNLLAGCKSLTHLTLRSHRRLFNYISSILGGLHLQSLVIFRWSGAIDNSPAAISLINELTDTTRYRSPAQMQRATETRNEKVQQMMAQYGKQPTVLRSFTNLIPSQATSSSDNSSQASTIPYHLSCHGRWGSEGRGLRSETKRMQDGRKFIKPVINQDVDKLISNVLPIGSAHQTPHSSLPLTSNHVLPGKIKRWTATRRARQIENGRERIIREPRMRLKSRSRLNMRV